MLKISYLGLFNLSVGACSTIRLMYSLHLARNTGCLSLIPAAMNGIDDVENGSSDKMHFCADSAMTLMVTTSKGNNAVM